jgi:PAS domain S-box-containing protein
VPGGWQVSPYSLVLGLAAALQLVLALAVWRRRARPGAGPFAGLLLAAGEWAALAALEHASVSPARKILCARLEYLGIMSVAPLWLTFALAYTGRGGWLTRARLALLAVVPVVTVGLVWTNEWHRLVWTAIVPSSATPGAPLVYGHGAWFWTAAAYNHALLVAGTAVIVSAVVRMPSRYRHQAIALFAGLAMPWIGNALYLTGASPLGGVDPTPLAFAATGAAYALGLFRHRLFDLVPVARHTVVESMADGVLVLDGDQRLLDANPAARALLGLDAAPWLGERADHVLAGWPALLAHLRQGTGAHVELTVDTAAGQRHLDLNVSPLRDGRGHLRGRLLVVGDVTARRRADDVLRQNEKLASLGQLLAGVAHELNNPLAVIVGHAALLQRQLAPGGVQARVEKIAAAADRCGRIVTSFLAVARDRAPERRATHVNEVLRGALDLLDEQLRADDVAVALELGDPLPPVWGDPQQLHQVAVNLIVNAQHAMRAAGRRQLTLRSWGDPVRGRVSFSVADTGPGVPAAHRGRIFEPFFTTKPVGAGSGLGLSVSRGIVEAHRGALELASEAAGGAVFVVTLPVAEAGAVLAGLPEPGPAAGTAPGRGAARRILVVDDEPMVAELLADMLAADGHQVELASDGQAALSRLAAARFDLVITDVVMPVLDGPGLYRQLERLLPDRRQRVVFITGDTLNPETARFLADTGARTLDKPFEADAVRRLAREAPGGADAAPGGVSAR